MGACLSCLGLAGRDGSDVNDESAPLIDPAFQPSYGSQFEYEPPHLRERDPEAVRRENAALESICNRVSSKMVDVMHDEAEDIHARPAPIDQSSEVSASAHKPTAPSGSTRIFQETAPKSRIDKDRRDSADLDDSRDGGRRRDVHAWLSKIEGEDEPTWGSDSTQHVATTPLLSRGGLS